MNEEILDKKIKHFEDQLLDLGKRNKMISFRETKRATMRILKPDFAELYDQIVTQERELTFQKAIDRDSDVRVYSILSLMDKLSYPMEVTEGDIRAAGSLPEIHKTLRNLRSKAKLALDEQGTNILYLVFGFIEWREKGAKGDNWLKSPLLLVPVTLSLPTLNGQYVLKKHEDEIVVNPTLAYLFQKEYGITLPEFDSDKETPESFMQKMEQLVDERGWRILRQCSMGLVSFLKISMYNDLIRNKEQLKKNPIIRAFAGEQNEVNAPKEEFENFDHDAGRAVDSYQVLDADSSQQDAIVLSQKGVSFVMQGPPGTGKSQTITNIIAQGLADGKKILFVSEKMAALDVVYRRLADVHLADFCLSLHSHKANKKEILNQLGNNLNLERRKVKDEEIAKLTKLDVIKEQLKAYVQDIHKAIAPLEMSLYEVYGAILELGSLPDIDLRIENVDQLSKDDVNRLALMVMDLDNAQNVLGPQWYKNPWQGITGPYLEVSQKRELQNKLYDAIRVVTELENCVLVQKNLTDFITLDGLAEFQTLCDHGRYCEKVPNSWFNHSTEQEEKLVQSLGRRRRDMDQLRQTLSANFGREFLDLCGADQLAQLHNAIGNARGLLRHTSTDAQAYDRMGQDREQLERLHELTASLIEDHRALSEAYQLQLPCDFASAEKLVTVCQLLSEKHRVTAHYFGEKLETLKALVRDLQGLYLQAAQHKRKLLERYSEEVLKLSGADLLLRRLDAAMNGLQDVCYCGRPEYEILKAVSAFDQERLRIAEEICGGELVRDTCADFGFEQPVTLAQVYNQHRALSALPNAQVIDQWRTSAGRAQAKQMLEACVDHAAKLVTAEENLKAYLIRAGIAQDADQMSCEELRQLRKIGDPIGEPAAIVSSCANSDVYALLDAMDKNAEEMKLLLGKIQELRRDCHIIAALVNRDLLAHLEAFRPNAEKSSPCVQWAQDKQSALDLLGQLTDLSEGLRKRHGELTAEYEDGVFRLDHAAMLDRFKTEYTGFLKIFKASYKADIKQVRLVSKTVRKKLTDDEIVSLLQSLRQYHEDLQKYQGLSEQAARMLDVRNYDMSYDWTGVKQRLEAFESLSALFDSPMDAYRFIAASMWNEIMEPLKRYDELENWFADHEQGKNFFAGLYAGKETDTRTIRAYLRHAKQMCELFVSTDHYLRIVGSENERQNFLKEWDHAAIVAQEREWFAQNAQQIEHCTALHWDGKTHPWQSAADQLTAYETVAGIMGDAAAYTLVSRRDTDRKAISAYRTALQKIANVENCAGQIYQTRSVAIQMMDEPLGSLCDRIRGTIAAAGEWLSIYDSLVEYATVDSAALSEKEMRDSLEAVVFYQNALDQLAQRQEEACAKIGAEYAGLQTDWNVVNENIAMCERVNALLSGNVSTELTSAFVDGVSLYAQPRIAQMEKTLAAAQQIDSSYLEISRVTDLHDKQKRLSAVLLELENAENAANTVRTAAFQTVGYSQIVTGLQKLASLQNAQMQFEADLAAAQSRMPFLELSEDSDWDAAIALFDHVKQVKRAISANNLDGELVQWLTNGIDGISVTSYYPQIEKLIRNQSAFTDFTALFAEKDAMNGSSLSKLSRRLHGCNDQFATMDAWIDLRDCAKTCRNNGLAEFIEKAEDAFYPQGSLKDVFMKSFYYAWFEKVCGGIESVSGFRVRTHNDRVETFKALDSHQLPVDQMRIRERLIRQMPSRNALGHAADEMTVLRHELNKKRNIMPLRKLFRAIPNLLLRLKPCLMMSPLSVSYFLEAETYKFDMVIFDEASQIFPQDAIGAIFRAKQVIIAGDSKQLPPTNFFAASMSNDPEFDADDEDVQDILYDSILEEASSSLPNRSLLWHYRSRHEDLITFSNREIYGNNLITFPANRTQVEDTGVEYVHVLDGVYESKTNRAEAQHIARMVMEHIQKHPDRSLGIIAFSENQQGVIEDEIHKLRTKNPANERFFDEEKDEPFFVKNLENVQGDERDTIILSICYGKNRNGKMSMNFGPLNRQGGERRLNVAITRAKQNLKLVGSILPEDINLASVTNEGPKLLRSYINFAMNGSTVLPQVEKKNSLYDIDVFSAQVGKFLTQHGCKIQMNVGSSDYTIDIAVEHPKRAGHFIAGIECDGNSYYMARTVRDRDHLRTAMLERMGWKMYRVWSTEWIRNPAAEQERLLNFVREALLHYGEEGEITQRNDEPAALVGTEAMRGQRTTKNVDPNNPYGFPKYEVGTWKNVSKHRRSDAMTLLADRILAVVKVEQPIHIELLYRRMLEAFDVSKVTQYVRDTVNEAIRTRLGNEVYISDQFVCQNNMHAIKVRRSDIGAPHRDIEYIAIGEIAAAMVRILEGAYGMERNVLCLEAAKVFGYERIGTKIRQRTNEAVDYLVRERKVSDYDGKIQLLEE